MERALFHGERGRGRTSPNPSVGAVIVSADGVVVGQGVTEPAGGAHAEVVALGRAGALASGGTLYCTLEPCSHAGRTGPCVERVLAAGVRRVVAATRDRNPLVLGRGFDYLRSQGLEVVEGVGRQQAERQHAAFFTWVTRRRPFVILKSAISVDGFVGYSSRRVHLTGPAADRFFHRQRAEVDAIAVGGATVVVDDPLLTARGAYRFRPLTRVIFDWRGQVPEHARVFETLDAGPVIMVVGRPAAESDPSKFNRLTARGVSTAIVGTRDLLPVLASLADREIVTLLVEGGPTLHRAFAEAGLVDRVQEVRTSRALGEGVHAVRLVADEMRVHGRQRALGDDVLMEFDVHRID